MSFSAGPRLPPGQGAEPAVSQSPSPQVWKLTHTPACQASLARSWDPPHVLPLTELGQSQAGGPTRQV